MSRFDYETEMSELKSEMTFLAYAVESIFSAAVREGLPEDESDSLSYGACVCFRGVLDRLDRLEKHVLADVL